MSSFSEIEEKIYSKILDFVSYSPRTEKEVVDKYNRLVKKYYPRVSGDLNLEEKLSSILDKLRYSGLLNDEEYVLRYLDGLLLSGKSKSIREAAVFLYKKGIPREMSERLLEVKGHEIQKNSLDLLVNKKIRGAGVFTQEKRIKLIKYLVSKGFSSDEVRAAVDRTAPLK